MYEDINDRDPRPKQDGAQIKERHLALMTAAVLWFMLLCGFVVVGAFILKLVGAILG